MKCYVCFRTRNSFFINRTFYLIHNPLVMFDSESEERNVKKSPIIKVVKDHRVVVS